MKKANVVIFLVLSVFILIGCGKIASNKVVVYTSLDQIFSEPILKEFEKETGIKVRAIYDVEAAKTVGLVNRLIAERNNPQADVFWNSEICRTIALKKKGILAPYFSKSAYNIPSKFKDKDGFWAGFAARARVLVYNKDLVREEELPASIFELTNPKWKDRVALANPLFGTTSTHCTALFIELGNEAAKKYFEDLKTNSVHIVDGNSTSRDRVANGILSIGFTDTDDVNVALLEGKNIGMVFPDKNGIGTLLIPNTVCLIKNCPHPTNAKRLIDFLLSERAEEKLAFSGSLQIPLRDSVAKPLNTPSFRDFKPMDVNYEIIADKMEESNKILQDILR